MWDTEPRESPPWLGSIQHQLSLMLCSQSGKSWVSSYCIVCIRTSANLHPHSQQDASKDTTAKEQGPQTPSVHPPQSW